MAGESANVGYAQYMHLRRRKNAANARGDLNFMSSHFWPSRSRREVRPATSISSITLTELIFDAVLKKDRILRKPVSIEVYNLSSEILLFSTNKEETMCFAIIGRNHREKAEPENSPKIEKPRWGKKRRLIRRYTRVIDVKSGKKWSLEEEEKGEEEGRRTTTTTTSRWPAEGM